MASHQAPENPQDSESSRQPISQTGSTRFRNTDYAEQREHWPEDDDRR